MAFRATLASGTHLFIENRAGQTFLTFQSGGDNQRQSQRSGFSSGEWTHPPTLFQTNDGLVLRIEAERNHYLKVENNSAHSLSEVPDLRTAQTLPLQSAPNDEASPAHMAPMKPMKPMEPLTPLEPLKPMELRMGSMHMSMGNPSPSTPEVAPSSTPSPTETKPESNTPPQKRAAFCTNCGQKAQEGDRFCARCGQELRLL